MDTQIILAIIAIVAAPLGAWISAILLRQKYKAEIAGMKADIDQKLSDVRSNELDNVRKANEILMETLVEPVQKELKGVRNELNKFRRAFEKIQTCPMSADCPVRNELQPAEKIAEHSNGA